MGNRQAMLEQAKNRIQKEIGVISACSEIYETAAWGKADQPSFLNQALEITALLSAREVLSGVLSI